MSQWEVVLEDISGFSSYCGFAVRCTSVALSPCVPSLKTQFFLCVCMLCFSMLVIFSIELLSM